jgi:hypothetical protein
MSVVSLFNRFGHRLGCLADLKELAMSGATFAVSAILSVLAILGTLIPALAADDRPRTNAVLDGQLAARPVNVMQRTCEGEDGTYLEIRGTFAGTVTSSDDRLTGDLEFLADALINVSPKGLGTFQGPFEISDPVTGKRKARGVFHTVVTDVGLNHGFAVGTVFGGDGSSETENFFARFQSLVATDLSVTGVFGNVGGDPRLPAVTQSGQCSGRFTLVPNR